jgi:V/A-type H+-transporting ATPase subunit F
MYKIGVIGDKDSVMAFKALGVSTFPVISCDEAAGTIDRLAREDYAVIFITEQTARGAEETISKYNRSVLPSIILIPSNQGSLGIGLGRIRENVEKAVGVDILSEKEGR